MDLESPRYGPGEGLGPRVRGARAVLMRTTARHVGACAVPGRVSAGRARAGENSSAVEEDDEEEDAEMRAAGQDGDSADDGGWEEARAISDAQKAAKRARGITPSALNPEDESYLGVHE